MPDLEALGSKTLVVKIIYSGLAAEGYGKLIHQYLARHDMAPQYFFPFNVKLVGLPDHEVHMECHHVMEYLAPLSDESSGWIFNLEEQFPTVASGSKQDIKNALIHIIHVLQICSW